MIYRWATVYRQTSVTQIDPPAIIAKSVRWDEKEELYRARKVLRNKSTQDLDYLAANKIYILEFIHAVIHESFGFVIIIVYVYFAVVAVLY